MAAPLPKQPLAGAVIALRCGEGEPDKTSWEEGTNAGCRDLVKLIISLGGLVATNPDLLPPPEAGSEVPRGVASAGAQPSYRLTYIDRASKSDFCTWTLVLAIVSWSLFPCVVDRDVGAELIFADSRGVELERDPLVAQVRDVYGLGAFFFSGPRALGLIPSEAQEAAQRQRRLITYVTGLLYAFQLRLEVASAAGWGA